MCFEAGISLVRKAMAPRIRYWEVAENGGEEDLCDEQVRPIWAWKKAHARIEETCTGRERERKDRF